MYKDYIYVLKKPLPTDDEIDWLYRNGYINDHEYRVLNSSLVDCQTEQELELIITEQLEILRRLGYVERETVLVWTDERVTIYVDEQRRRLRITGIETVSDDPQDILDLVLPYVEADPTAGLFAYRLRNIKPKDIRFGRDYIEVIW